MLLGIDIGTQSLKAVVTDDGLRRLGTASRFYTTDFPAAERAEQSPSIWERALLPAIGEALECARAAPSDIKAIGIAGQLDGCIPVNARGDAMGNCLVWMDRRAGDALQDVDREMIHALTGLVADPSHLAAKARWLKANLSDAGSIAAFHQPVSYLVERFTGARVIDHALASTSMVYSLSGRVYDDALLASFDLTSGELPSVLDAHEGAGELNDVGAQLTGLRKGTTVAVGTGDDFATPLGAGVSEPDILSVAIGTGEVVGCLFREPTIDPACLVETHAYPADHYFLENPGWLSGGAVKWLMGILGIPDFSSFEMLAARAPAGCDGMIFLPALTGAMAPEWISGARGCFYGISAAHGPQHFARALLEGCSFAMRDIVDRLIALGAKPQSLNVIGGGSRSSLWTQMRADTMNMPASTCSEPDASPLGAAMLAAVAGGVMPDLRSACACGASTAMRFAPSRQDAETLDDAYRRYRLLFASLKPVFVGHRQ